MLIKIRFRFPEVAFGILLAVAIFAMGATLWSSHYPSSDKQHTEANQHSATKSNDKTREPQSLWIPTDSVGLYTLVLCVFTGVLALVSIFQGVMLLRSDKTSRIAADAAKLNAQAVIAAEGAYIFVEICRQTVVDIIKYMQDMPSVSPRPILIQYRFMNHGKTPAVIKEISYGAIVAENLPKQREYSQILHLPTHLLGAEKPTETLEYDEFQISYPIASSIMDLKATFWFFGNIVYDDMFDRQRTLDFVFHVSGVSEGFTLYRYVETEEKRKS